MSYENIFELIQGAYPLHEVTDQEEYEVEDAPIDIIEEQAENVFIEKFGEPIEVFLDNEAENVFIEEFGEPIEVFLDDEAENVLLKSLENMCFH